MSQIYPFSDGNLHLVIAEEDGWRTACGIDSGYRHTCKAGKSVRSAVTCPECVRHIAQVRQYLNTVRLGKLH